VPPSRKDLKRFRQLSPGDYNIFRAQRSVLQGSLDEYIDFLSDNMEIIEFTVTKYVTNDYKL